MNCRRIEKLMPLYVEGDLASDLAHRITSHIEWCGRCNFLADEYKASQSWLHSSEPPEFDEASLSELKAGVLRRINQRSARPSLIASLSQQWGRRQVFALSTAMLVIFGVVVFYIFQARRNATPQVIHAVKQPLDSQPAPSDEPQQKPGTEKAQRAGLSGPHHINSQASIKTPVATPISPQPIEPPFVSQTNPTKDPAEGAAAATDQLPGDVTDTPGMLRIEIQTSDPNIRIIWFAPRDVEIPKTNQ